MVVLDQLPMVCTNLEGGCLLPDEFLIHPPPSVTPALVKSKIHPASYMLWDKLYEHLVKIVKYNIMLSHEVRDYNTCNWSKEIMALKKGIRSSNCD